jgi:hypothetical protein
MSDFLFDPNELGPLDCTPADERFADRLANFTPYDAHEFLDYIEAKSGDVGLDYIKDDGTRIIIPITPTPAAFSARQTQSLRKSFEILAGAVAKVASAWLDTPALHHILPLEPYEAEWLRLSRDAPGEPAKQIFHRWDFALNLSADPDAEAFKLFEVNSVDVGGIHYAAAAREVMSTALRLIGIHKLTISHRQCGADPRLILLTAIMRHPSARNVGRKLRVAIAENQDFKTGITEAESIRKFFRKRFVKTECVDARAFEVDAKGEVAYRDKPVDVVYRNIELRDLAELETAGGSLSGLRAAAKAGKWLSSPFGELDHKSLWEALGSEEFLGLFSAAERTSIGKHVPWTRLVSERRTDDRSGREIDLLDYIRRNRQSLVLKPNRSCGGQGVTIGKITAAAAWDRAIDTALAAPNTCVAQEFIPIPRRKTCRVTDDGRFEPQEVFAVYGGYHSMGGPAFVGRASSSPIVNVMQGGGLLAVLGKLPKK